MVGKNDLCGSDIFLTSITKISGPAPSLNSDTADLLRAAILEQDSPLKDIAYRWLR